MRKDDQVIRLANVDRTSDVGTGIGVVILIALWFFTDCFLAVGYGVYRLAKRP